MSRSRSSRPLPDPEAPEPPEPVGPLPSRPPRPLLVHWLVDSAIAFLVMAFVALLLGVAIWWIAVAALLIGLPIAPWTRRAEERTLARRAAPDA